MRIASRLLSCSLVVAVGACTSCTKLREKVVATIEAKAREYAADAGTDAGVATTASNPNGVTELVAEPPSPSAIRAVSGMKLPDDFPASVPVYPGSKISAAVTSDAVAADEPGAKGYVVVFQTDDPADMVTSFYSSALKRTKRTVDMTAGKTRMLTFHDDSARRDVTLTITPEKDHTTVSLTTTPSTSRH
jgi:hypothetical protein